MANLVTWWDEGPTRHIVLDRPAQKNALSMELLHELEVALQPPSEGVIKLVFLSGRDGVFSAGADLNDIQGSEADAAYDDQVTAVTEAIAAFPGLVVAVIEGPCMGAAVHLALACDLRIADETAKINIPAARLGLLYNPDAIRRIHPKLPAETLTRLLVLGETFSADAAMHAGLISDVRAQEGLEAHKNQLIDQMAANDADAVALSKSLLRDLDQGTADPAKWKATYLALLGTESRAEAVARAKSKLGLAGTKTSQRAAE